MITVREAAEMIATLRGISVEDAEQLVCKQLYAWKQVINHKLDEIDQLLHPNKARRRRQIVNALNRTQR